jgi:hypothetical protein
MNASARIAESFVGSARLIADQMAPLVRIAESLRALYMPHLEGLTVVAQSIAQIADRITPQLTSLNMSLRFSRSVFGSLGPFLEMAQGQRSLLTTASRGIVKMAELHAQIVSSSTGTLSLLFEHSVAPLPAGEVFLGSVALRELAASEESEQPESAAEIDDHSRELSAQVSCDLEHMLADVDAEFLSVWRGAHEAAESENPDRVRHALVSLRELCGHLVRRLAPDDHVAQWTSDPSHFHGGRPTRKARLLYMVRTCKDASLDAFMEADVSATVHFLDFLNAGAHALRTSIGIRQLRAILCKADSLLRFLIGLSRV